jgi:hypothetical protein
MLMIPPITKLELNERVMQAILQGLTELPYKLSQPALAEIEKQLMTQQPADAPPAPEPPKDLKTEVSKILKGGKPKK